MREKLLFAVASVFLAVAAMVLPLSSAYAIESFAIETELRLYNPAKSYGGYFMTSNDSTGGQTVYLMDMMGYVVKQWDNVKGTPYLLENSNLWSCGQVQSWDGKVLWSFDLKTDRPDRPDITALHHAGRRIWNKKLKQYTHLLIAWRTATKEELIAAGGDPGWDYSNAFAAGAKAIVGRLTNHDVLIEVNDKKEIIWEWRYLDHTVQSKNPAWPNYVSDVALAPERLDTHYKTASNSIESTDQFTKDGLGGICNDWMHINSVDYNEDLDLIVTNSRPWGEFYVIDHGKTFVSTADWAANRTAAKGPLGDFIYRFGNSASYNQGTAPSFMSEGTQQIWLAHNIQWIRPYHWERPHAEAGDNWPDPLGYTKSGIANPGAGNFLIYDNGEFNPTGFRSRIREINPYLNAAGVNTGWFVNPPLAGYSGPVSGNDTVAVGGTRTSKQVIWNYQSKVLTSFYSRNTSGCQRLPNGNTSIQSSAQGHSFEVTPTGEVVWEYQFPGYGAAAKTVMTDSVGATKLFRHYRYSPDYPGLAGKDLTPRSTITGRIPRTVGSDFTYPTPVTYYGFGMGAGGTTVGGGSSVSGGAGTGSGY
jgi:hypothetical protein